MNKNNEIIVTDFHNHSVKVLPCSSFYRLVDVPWWLWLTMSSSGQVFTPEGELVLKFGSNGEGNGQFNAPTGVAVDINGNIIVADWGNSRIQVKDCSAYFVSLGWKQR